MTLFIIYEFNLFKKKKKTLRIQVSQRNLSIPMGVRAYLLRIFNKIPFEWIRNAQNALDLVGKTASEMVKGWSSKAVGYSGKGIWCEVEIDKS